MVDVERMPIGDDVLFYKMNRKQRGKLVIFNNMNFRGMSKREGSDIDAAKICRSFKDLGFKVKIMKDQTYMQMKEYVHTESQADHQSEDCFAICILTHGNDQVIYGSDDSEIVLEDLINELKTCPSLAGKPKLLFIDASLGDKEDGGIQAEADGDGHQETKKIPIEADFLYSYSTVQGYKTLRTSNKDSWYIEELSKNLKEFGKKLELVEILTRVNDGVSKKFEAGTGNKQTPSFTSMLTKQVYFNRI